MKKYILALTSLGTLLFFGLTGFIIVEKSHQGEYKKITRKVNPACQLGLYTKPLTLESENKYALQTTKPDAAYKEQLLENIATLPLVFEKNMGQWKEEILYRANAQSAQVGFRKNGVTFCSTKEIEEEYESNEHDEESNEDDEKEAYGIMVWNLNFKGMNTNTQIFAEGEVVGITSYFIGNDSTKWVKNAPESKLINYQGIYDNIDLHYYGLANNKLKYDYIVNPGGTISNIQMELDGAKVLKINNRGELIIKTPWGEVAEDKPFSYQVINGVKKEVDVRYNILDDKTFGFKAYGGYDQNYDLVIDPQTLIWNTYLKGKASIHYVQDIAIDGSMNSYITGWTKDLFDFSTGAFQTTAGSSSGEDGFITKMNRFGTTKIYSTYMGGTNDERFFGIGVNSSNEAIITGWTESSNYPKQSAFDGTLNGTKDAVATKINAAGNGLQYSTYIGGASSDEGYSIFINAAGEAYITGIGKGGGSNAFPTTASVIRPDASANGSLDVFITKLSTAGANSFTTLYGGTGDETGYGIFVDATGAIYITGQTKSTDFPTTGGLYTTLKGTSDAFVSKINTTATLTTYSTYLGGTGLDGGHAIYVLGNIPYVSGETTSADFPTAPATPYQAANAGGVDMFVTKFTATATTLSALSYSTYIGSAGDEGEITDDRRSDIVVNPNGEAYLTAVTLTGGYPMTSTYGGFDTGYNLEEDGVISLFNATGTALLCSSYLGGNKHEYTRFAIDFQAGGGASDTLYTSLTVHSDETTYPVGGTQGAVYSAVKQNTTGDDEPSVIKWASCNITLPITLTTFKGINKGDHNFLEWATATEINNDYFTLERSSDGINFTAIGTIDGVGNSSSLLNYSYSDQKEGNEITYYRLKQTDFDGKTTYSKIVVINAPETNKGLQLTISSPVTDYLNYTVCCLQKGDAKVEVVDMTGKVVMSTNVQVNEGYNKFSLDAKNISAGAYILKFTSDNGNANAKFVK